MLLMHLLAAWLHLASPSLPSECVCVQVFAMAVRFPLLHDELLEELRKFCMAAPAADVVFFSDSLFMFGCELLRSR